MTILQVVARWYWRKHSISTQGKQIVLGWILLNPVWDKLIRSYIYDSGCRVSEIDNEGDIQHVTFFHLSYLIALTGSKPKNPNLRSALKKLFLKMQIKTVFSVSGFLSARKASICLVELKSPWSCHSGSQPSCGIWWLKLVFTSLTWGRLIIFQFTVARQPSRARLCNKTTNFIS